MLQTGELKPGYRAKLRDFGATPLAYRRRLIALGLINGVEVHLVRTAPFGCPLYLQIGHAIIALRKEEAKHLSWERL
jgi:ferrous iron transport protein A